MTLLKSNLFHIAAAMLLAAASHTVNAAPGPAPQPFTRDCTWFAHLDADLMNVAFPDTAANYWIGAVAVPSVGEVRIEGQFPHARYMSFNLYNPILAPFDSLSDTEIRPDVGSVNPFRPGANRNAFNRSYSVSVVAEPPPTDPSARQPNTLYAGFTGPLFPAALVVYRVYVADRGNSIAGNVDLPRIRYVLPGGIQQSLPAACDFLEQLRGLGVNELLSSVDQKSLSADSSSATDPLVWKRFVSTPVTVTQRAQGVSPLAGLPVWDPAEQALLDSGIRGGSLSNRDNAYVTSTISHELGEIAVLSAKAPTTPRTYRSTPIMQCGRLRYWSLCSNDAVSQRFWDCLYDEQAPLDGDGYYTIVVSTPETRPASARLECGVTWLDWGPRATSLLIFRNMLPAADFTGAVQSVPYLSGTERQVMGQYYPYGLHLGKAAFEALSDNATSGDPALCRPNLKNLRARAAGG